MEEIQTYYQIPSIAHFCNLFRDSLNLPDFDYEDLEFALLSNISTNESDLGSNQNNLVLRLICALLKGYFDTHINHLNWEKYLQKLFQIQWVDIEKKRSPFVGFDEKGEEYCLKFDALPLRTKVDVIHCLCDYRLFKDDISQLINDINADNYRVEPLGTDSKGYNYWYFYGTRLYRENPTVAQNIELNYKKFDELVVKRAEDIKRNIESERVRGEQELKRQALSEAKRKKEEEKKRNSLPPKGSRTGLRQRKSEQSVPNGVCTSKSDSSVESISKKFENSKDLNDFSVSLSRRQESWSLVCQTEQDWKDLCKKFEKSKNKNEIEFYKLLSESFVPKISEIFETQERDKSKLERQKLFDLLPRRISSRIELKKIQKEKEDIVEEESSRRKLEESERKNMESDRQRSERIKQEREKRAQKRLQLVEERAERAMKRDRIDGNLESDSQTSDQNQDSYEAQLQYINEEFIDIPVRQTNIVESFYEALEKVIHSVKSNRDAWPFMEEVDGNKFPMYYQVIEEPIDLSIIERKVENRLYDTFEEMEEDFKLMVNNCETFNGEKNGYTLMAYGIWRAFKKASLRYLERQLSYNESNAFIYPQKVTNTNIKPAIEAKKKKMLNKRRSTFKALNALAKAAEKAVEDNDSRVKRMTVSTASSLGESSPRSSHSCDSNTSVCGNESTDETNRLRIHGDMWADFLFNANNTSNTDTALNSLAINTSTHENLTFKSLDEWSKSIKQSGNCIILPQNAVIISSPQFTHCTNRPVIKPPVSLKVVTTGANVESNPINTFSCDNTFTSSVISNNENARKELVNANPKRLVIKLSRCESSGQVWKPVSIITSSAQNNFNTTNVNSSNTNGQTNWSSAQQFQRLRTLHSNIVDFNNRPNDKLLVKSPTITGQTSLNTNSPTPKDSISPAFQITGIQQNKNSNLKVFKLKKLEHSANVYHSNGLPTNQSSVIPKAVLIPLDKQTSNGTGLSGL